MHRYSMDSKFHAMQQSSSDHQQSHFDSTRPNRLISAAPISPHDTSDFLNAADSGLTEENRDDSYTLASYEHPYDIPPPQNIYKGDHTDSPEQTQPGDPKHAQKRQGLLANVMDWYSMTKSGTHQLPDPSQMSRERDFGLSDGSYALSTGVDSMHRNHSVFSQTSFDSDFLDPDDPRVTGQRAEQVDDKGDLEKNVLRQMDYRSRRKHIQRIRIEFNVSCKISVILSLKDLMIIFA